MKCGFAKMSTKGTFEPVWPYGTDIYGRFLYLESGKERVLIAAFDLSASYPREAARWRREVARRTGIPEKSVWYHELQIHAAPEFEQMAGKAMDALIDRSVETILELIDRAEECDCYVAECDMGTEFTFNREQYVEELGGVTVWTGMSFDEEGRPYTQNPDIMLLRGYQPKLPVFDQPIYFDNPNDQMAYLFLFKNKEGKTIGTLSRFAAHPDAAVLFEQRFHPNKEHEYHYDFDWPGYLSEDMEKVFGGIGMYINGPCADLSAKKSYDGMDTYEDSAADCRRLASLIGDRMREIFTKNAVKLDVDAAFKTESFEITLPMKEDIPYTYDEIRSIQPQTDEAQRRLDEAIARGEAPAHIKRLIDDRWRIGHINHLIRGEEYSFTEQQLATHEVTVCVTALRFGGYLFVGVPGESLVDITLWLRSRFSGTKTVSVDQVGGYYNYMATPRSMTLGGYTYWSSWVRRDAIPIFKAALAPKLDEFMRD